MNKRLLLLGANVTLLLTFAILTTMNYRFPVQQSHAGQPILPAATANVTAPALSVTVTVPTISPTQTPQSVGSAPIVPTTTPKPPAQATPTPIPTTQPSR